MTTNRALRKKAVATVMLAELAHTTGPNGETAPDPRADRAGQRQRAHGVRRPMPLPPRQPHCR